nr:hypothetical protein [Tanacetum cinerariifolium]
MQTQTTNTLHNAIMEAGGKDRPPMLAPDKDVPIFEGSSKTTTERRSHADPTLWNDFEMAAEGNGDPPVPNIRTMKELCQPSLNGGGGPCNFDDDFFFILEHLILM